MNFQKQSLFGKLLTIVLLLALLAGGWRWLSARQSRDVSFLLPIYQDGQEIKPSAIIGENGQVLLPVAAIAENNGWQQRQYELEGKEGALCGSSLLLLDEAGAGTLAVCWFTAEPGRILSLGVWHNGQLLGLSAPGRLYRGQLYLPEDFFAAAFDLSLKLDENGRANLVKQPKAQPPTA